MPYPKIGVLAMAALGVFACTGEGTIGQKNAPVTGGACETPGDTATMDDGCNECTCGGEQTWVCTEMECGGEPCEEGGATHPDGASWTCSDGCNTCNCADGVVNSTDIACGDGDGGAQCEPGENRPAGDGCNWCNCMDDGRWACSVMDCSAGHCVFEGGFYANGTSFHTQDDCEDCRCENGVVTCVDGGGCESCKVGDVMYAHGESWKCDCNTCFCDNGGLGSTLVACNECQPGDFKVAEDLCNTCSCNELGQWNCTFKDCDIPSCVDASDCEPLEECDDTCDPPSCRRSACWNSQCVVIENSCTVRACDDVSDCPDPPRAFCTPGGPDPCPVRACIDNVCVDVFAESLTSP